jgi:hypothetical protein
MKENKELRELSMDEVDAVSGGGLLGDLLGTVGQIVTPVPIVGPIAGGLLGTIGKLFPL